jgi:hypothetical protein
MSFHSFLQVTVDDLLQWYLDSMDEHPEPYPSGADAMKGGSE